MCQLRFEISFVNWHNAKLAATFDNVIATTDFAAAEFVRIKTNNLRKVALGVDLIGFNPENRNYKLRKELLKGAEFLLVHCGRMSPEKQPERSVQALAELIKRGVNARLIIVGGGPLWNKVRNKAPDYQLTWLVTLQAGKKSLDI